MGSNILNVLVILGASAVITPLAVSARLVRYDVPLMIAASFLLWGFACDGRLGRLECAALLSGLVAYLAWLFRQGKRDSGNASRPASSSDAPAETAVTPATTGTLLRQLALIAIGLVLLTVGSRWLVGAAAAIARLSGVSELVIGLTMVAMGTSLPEAATSVLGALRGQRDIAVGNIVGSNLFNILGILAAAGIVSPTPLAVSPAAIRFDIPAMTAVALACLPIFFTGQRIARWEGALLLGCYVVYTIWLIGKRQDFSHRGADAKSLLDEVLCRGREERGGAGWKGEWGSGGRGEWGGGFGWELLGTRAA